MEKIDWSKAPPGCDIWLEYLEKALDGDKERQAEKGEWVKECDDRYITRTGSFWTKPEEGYYRIHRKPDNKSWNGTGLPPVGTVCQFCAESSSAAWRRGLKNGDEVEILAHYSPLDDGDLVAVFCYEIEGGKLTEQAVAHCFRPIRTPEQIAAEERDRAIEELTAGYLHSDVLKQWAERAYDELGYRKPTNQPQEDK